MSIYLGLLSGTSMDGIDAALVDFPSHTLIHARTYPWDAQLRADIAALCEEQATTPKALATLHTRIGRAFGEASVRILEEAALKPQQVTAIGSHGQTVFHDAFADIPVTVQLGCAHTIAEMTGIQVVSDFRTRDLIAGGQGAPLAPAYHAELFGKSGKATGIVNIGGIANVSFVSEGGARVHGFDTGPGNCLMDAWCSRVLGKAFDADGRFAAEGRVIPALLDKLLSDPWFSRPIPRSADKGYFGLDWLLMHCQPEYSDADIQATLLALTVTTITKAITDSHAIPDQVLICGGGAHNSTLLAELAKALPVPVESTAAVNIHPDFVEAMLFAWLAERAISRTPLQLGAITGSTRPVMLGAVYPAPM